MLYTKLVLMALFWSGVFTAVSIVLKSMGLFTSVFMRLLVGGGDPADRAAPAHASPAAVLPARNGTSKA
jgi:hypothetical protein